ncbi:GroES-like protein [Coprinellus micaceus]|uniref:GroES-like protein n=1 Tax=Coprinellus micaceus TaxID=71717 RepID=A0A4Y7THM9_COPMI|nr:GroES-like protein [Coprinellus micaceus]
MSTQKSLLLLEAKADYVLNRAYPIPQPGKDEILVKIKASAINPGDYWVKSLGKVPGRAEGFPIITGFDIAGDVVKLGEGVTKFKVGDRVFFAGNFDPAYGGFQEYTLTDVDTAAIIPPGLSYDDGSTLSVSFATGYIGLYGVVPLGLGLKSILTDGGIGAYSGKAIFIAGGSSSSGVAAIQLAKLSGFTYIVTTSSLHNRAYLQGFGATHVLDRKLSPEQLASELKNIKGLPKLEYAFDAYGDENTSFAAATAALSPGGRVVTVSPVIGGAAGDLPDGKVKSTFMAVKGIPVSRAYYVELFAGIEKLLEDGSIKPARSEVLPGGLTGVDEGLKRIEKGQVSGVKLVIHPEDTP